MRQAMLDTLKRGWENYARISDFDTKFWNEVAARSPFKKPANMQIVHPLLQAGFDANAVPERVHTLIMERSNLFKQSRAVERGFLAERRSEEGAEIQNSQSPQSSRL